MSSSSNKNNNDMGDKESKARLKSEQDDDDEGPVKKKVKQDKNDASSPASKKQQSSLLNFFTSKNSNSTKSPSKVIKPEDSAVKDESALKPPPDDDSKKEETSTNDATDKDATKVTKKKEDDSDVPDPIIPREIAPDRKAQWRVIQDCMLVRSIKSETPRTKVAAFDVDGTLLVWRTAGWPSKMEHYELWSSSVIDKLRDLHDNQGYKLILFSNQGAIRSAFTGKKATFIKSLFEWLAHAINRPVQIVLSTNKKKGFHKPAPGMWQIMEQYCNKGVAIEKDALAECFFVGDSVGDEDPQGGVDEKFAHNVGDSKGAALKFYTPDQYFGPSDSHKRKRQGVMADFDAPPTAALNARKALLGGYLQGPMVLLLCGVQGSGKSTFCQQVVALKKNKKDGSASSDSEEEENETNGTAAPWVHFSQDTISKGKPGNRQAVEKATREAIQQGCSVIVDRTHLDATQRKHFVDIAKELKVPVHILVLQPPKDVITKRVRERTNHPGKVQGDSGVRMALMSMTKLKLPNYKEEGFDLITCGVQRDSQVKQLSTQYRQVRHKGKTISDQATLQRRAKLSCGISMPTLALGTMKVGKRIGTEVVKGALDAGWRAVDTAPTYNDNEEVVGKGLAAANSKTFVIVKVPKRATQPEQVRQELVTSLKKLGLQKAGLLMLHWPCDVIEGGTLKSVWEAMEKCVADGKCDALGVSNFSVDALRQLLPHCTILPSVNQVERHPLLPQTALHDFCINQGIVLQAHTTLGQGKLLSNETIMQVAKQAKLTPAQLLVQWNVRQGVACVCKCASNTHQEELLLPFHSDKSPLTKDHMKALDEIKEKKRFISPPFMMIPGAVYSWRG